MTGLSPVDTTLPLEIETAKAHQERKSTPTDPRITLSGGKLTHTWTFTNTDMCVLTARLRECVAGRYTTHFSSS